MKYVGLAHYCIPGRNGLNEIVLIKEDHNFEITTTSLPNLSVLFGLVVYNTDMEVSMGLYRKTRL